jgi:PTS system mannose-specific IIA component
VLFTDMPGGSVNNTAVQMMVKYPHAHVISGANLIMLMEFCMSEHVDTAQRLQDAVAAASGAMQYMNQLPEIMAARQATQHKTQDNIDDFFAEEETRDYRTRSA